MNIRFRDVSSGIVEARAVIELAPGMFLNEVAILRKDDELLVELPQKSFKGRDNRMFFMDIITFENEHLKTLWEVEVKTAYIEWRKENKKVLVYSSHG